MPQRSSEGLRRAVIPAAGLGTRLLPATVAVAKPLLPLGPVPVISYVLTELLSAGIDEVLLIVAPDDVGLRRYLDPPPPLLEELERRGQLDAMSDYLRVLETMRIQFVVQPEPLGLGHAVGLAAEFVDDAPFAVVLPDEVYRAHRPGTPAGLGEMVRHFKPGYHASLLGVREVEHAETARYGIIAPGGSEDGLIRVAGLVEKPDPSRAPSRWAAMGRYVLSPQVMNIVLKLRPGRGGEIQLADALDCAAREGIVDALSLRAKRYDTGTVTGYAESFLALACETVETKAAVERAARSLGIGRSDP